MKRKIYEACGFRRAKSWYKIILQELLPEGTKFTINRGYIIQEEGYIPNYL